jgi:hypothetical protein
MPPQGVLKVLKVLKLAVPVKTIFHRGRWRTIDTINLATSAGRKTLAGGLE